MPVDVVSACKVNWFVCSINIITVPLALSSPPSPPIAATEQQGEQRRGSAVSVAVFGDEAGDIVTKWGALAVVALGYVAIGAWDWTDTVEALARSVQ